MTHTEPLTTGDAAEPAVTRPGPRSVAVPGLTRITAAVIVAGVLVQAILAGGFLAGRPGLVEVHMIVGVILGLTGIILLVGGLIGRRSNPEPVPVLATRTALLLALVVTLIAGMAASELGTRDLLMLHIPLAFIIMGLAGRLLRLSRTEPAQQSE